MKASLTITRQGFMIALAFAILTLYLFPLFLIVDAAIKSDGFQEEITGSGFGWFVAFLKHSDSTLGQFHKILFPILTGLSVVMLKEPITKTYAFLVTYILFGFALSVYAGVYFDMGSTLKALDLAKLEVSPALVSSFFARIQEVLLMYLALMLGLTLKKTP